MSGPNSPQGDDSSGFKPTVSEAHALALHRPHELQTALERKQEDEADDDSLTLNDLLRIVLKHKWTLLIVVALVLVAATVRTFLSTPIYRSTVVLQVERPPQVVRLETDTGQEGGTDLVSMNTHTELLKSRSLAERVIDELRLDQSRTSPSQAVEPPLTDEVPDVEQQLRGTAKGGYVERLVAGYRSLTRPSTRDAEVLGREAVIRGFLKSTTVEPVKGSRLIRLHVDNTDPRLAARIANATVQSFISMGLERRLNTSSYAKDYLEDQIKQTKARLEESERKLNQYAQAKEILMLDDKTSVINQAYAELAAAVARAEQERIKAEALATQVAADPQGMSAVVENKTIAGFKEKRAELQLEYQQNLRTYKPEYPKMLQLKAQIAEIDTQIKAEVDANANAVRAQYEAALRQETLLRQKLEQTRKQVLVTQDSSIDLNLLRREVDTNRQLYDNLLQRIKELGVTSNAVTNNISIVDAAEPSLFPYQPSLSRNLALGLAAGLLLGLALVFVLEMMDDSIKFPDEVERLLGLPLLGIIPKLMRKRGEDDSIALDVHNDPRSTLAEAYRSVRTALQFSTPEGAPKRLVITSSTRNEGKSTSALSLAISFAQMGQRVLLIDADMRNPSIHKLLGIPNEYGLSNLLSSDNPGQKMITPTAVPKLSVLTAGPIPPNPVDLLMGPKLQLVLNVAHAQGFEYVIVDAPPLLGLADSVVLGNQLQNILFVVRASSTRKSHIKNALRRLRLAGLVPRGVVLTQTMRDAVPQDYDYYYGYYGPEEENKKKGLRQALARSR